MKHLVLVSCYLSNGKIIPKICKIKSSSIIKDLNIITKQSNENEYFYTTICFSDDCEDMIERIKDKYIFDIFFNSNKEEQLFLSKNFDL